MAGLGLRLMSAPMLASCIESFVWDMKGNINIALSKMQLQAAMFTCHAFDDEKGPTDEEVKIIEEYNDVMTNGTFDQKAAFVLNKEKMPIVKTFSTTRIVHYPKDSEAFMLIKGSTKEQVDEIVKDLNEKDGGLFERFVWYALAGFYGFDDNDMKLAGKRSDLFKEIMNAQCRKVNMPEIYGVGSSEGTKFEDVKNGAATTETNEEGVKVDLKKVVPIRFNVKDKPDATDRLKESSKKATDRANDYIEEISRFADQSLPSVKKVYELQTNGTVRMDTFNDAGEYMNSYIFDMGNLFGNGVHISAAGFKNEGDENPIWCPIPLKNTMLATKALQTPGYTMSPNETTTVLAERFDVEWVYNYVDLAKNGLEKVANDEYKALGKNIEKVLSMYFNNGGAEARFRLANYKSPDSYALVSDNQVIFPLEEICKNITGDVLTVSPDGFIASNATTGLMKSFKFNE